MTATERAAARVPDRPSLDGLAEKWTRRWAELGTYTFDRRKNRSEVFAIDTPPLTVSGSVHIGHAFSYTHTDIVARFQRMQGKEVFYPVGWDDNGLPTERRVQNYFGVRCDPTLPYVAGYRPPQQPVEEQQAVSRRNFIELCERLTADDELVYEETWRRLGLSVDWSARYTTVGTSAQVASQRAFLRNLRRGEAYQAEAPSLWDISFGTAVAQAELEDRERPGAYHRLLFRAATATVDPDDDEPTGEPLYVETTRPELLPACVALVFHPDDDRYRHLAGTTAVTPLFGVEVPIRPHRLADPEKGTGLAMICTFGDLTDVIWWRELDLPIRSVIGRNGRIRHDVPAGLESAEAGFRYAQLAGLTVAAARRRIVKLLRESGELVGEPRAITHPVKFYEYGEAPLEIVTARQWYLRNGGRDLPLRERLLERGRELRWVPEFMRHRYEHWVNGLTGDWLVSRQRFFGVPIPVWYQVRDDGTLDHDALILPSEAELPVDPQSQPPSGYSEQQRGRPGGFAADPDVFDTWATSSLTPQIAGGWERDDDLFDRVFPMDLRPQAHEIIRTWLFSTTVRSQLEHDTLPWRTAVISGWILDPDRKKMSKSKGRAVGPDELLDRYGPDAVRYWAACGRPGADFTLDENLMRVGRRLATKVLNASRFVLGLGSADALHAPVTEPLDRAMLSELRGVIAAATAAFQAFDHTAALEAAERFFWAFCDDYLELVKSRAYGERGDAAAASARSALGWALSAQLRLLAPVVPFVTDEVWSWWRYGSIHRATWPTAHELTPLVGDEPGLRLATVGEALRQIRKAKSQRKVSMRTDVSLAEVSAPAALVEEIRLASDDLRAAGHLDKLEFHPEAATELVVACTF
ncbi:valine--tRNA ligase [Actinocatenispora comari]|uniref:Valine--tRNA ligase n=1 Tax=Actinocatenispora comari TaxID=2807577 RepID=A0A8J4AL23_9ACTN|nr:valine--tRNA ligase [Actinocatenispora comari]GIL31415.1 valine--tRNA ligase [Actinocatenispora comari]